MCNSINGSLYEVFSYEQYQEDGLIAGTRYDIINKLEQKTRDNYIILDEYDHIFLKNYIEDYNSDEYLYDSIYFQGNHEIKFKKLIEHIINCSETSSCLVLIREALESPEKIVRPISIDKFFEMVKKNIIYTNVEYIIKK